MDDHKDLPIATLDRYLDADIANAADTKRIAGGLWDAAEATVGLFSTLASHVVPPDKKDAHDGHLGLARTLLFAQRAALHGVADIARLHFIEATAELRRMLEWIAVGWHLHEKPDDYEVWVKAFRDGLDGRKDPSFRRYIRAFNPQAVQDRLKQLDPRLAQEYRSHNNLVHGTVVSQAFAVQVRSGGSRGLLAVSMIDVDSDNPMWVIGFLFQALNSMHLGLCRLGERVLSGEHLVTWNSERNTVANLVDAERPRWREQKRLWRFGEGDLVE